MAGQYLPSRRDGLRHPDLECLENNEDRYPTTVQDFKVVNNDNSSKNKYHPTQKPITLLEYLVKTYTHEGDTVLDFTMGSGTTGVACVKTGRSFIGIEIDKGYFEIAQKRIEEAQLQMRFDM